MNLSLNIPLGVLLVIAGALAGIFVTPCPTPAELIFKGLLALFCATLVTWIKCRQYTKKDKFLDDDEEESAVNWGLFVFIIGMLLFVSGFLPLLQEIGPRIKAFDASLLGEIANKLMSESVLWTAGILLVGPVIAYFSLSFLAARLDAYYDRLRANGRQAQAQAKAERAKADVVPDESSGEDKKKEAGKSSSSGKVFWIILGIILLLAVFADKPTSSTPGVNTNAVPAQKKLTVPAYVPAPAAQNATVTPAPADPNAGAQAATDRGQPDTSGFYPDQPGYCADAPQ